MHIIIIAKIFILSPVCGSTLVFFPDQSIVTLVLAVSPVLF